MMLGSDCDRNLVELMRKVSAIWKYDTKCAGARIKTSKSYPKFRFWSTRYVFIYYFMCTTQTPSDLRWRPDKNNNNFPNRDGFLFSAYGVFLWRSPMFRLTSKWSYVVQSVQVWNLFDKDLNSSAKLNV